MIKDIQMRFKDIDMFGHVNNTVYFEYMDYGKSCFINEVLGPLFNPQEDALVIVNINCDFMHPTLYTETLQVETNVVGIGQHSITFKQRVFNSQTSEVKCEARVVMVGYNAREKATIEIPQSWRESMLRSDRRL